MHEWNTTIIERPILIGVSGGSSSGKSEACEKIVRQLTAKTNGKKAVILSLSSFYRELTTDEKALAIRGQFDLDHPSKRLREVLQNIKNKTRVSIHIYDCSDYSSTLLLQEIPEDVDVVIVEGILTFYQKDVRDLFHLKVFVESDADTRLSRKDVKEKGRKFTDVLDNYFKFVKPAFEEFCLPTKKYADLILPRQPDNCVGVKLITEHLLQLVDERYAQSNVASQFFQRRARNQSESSAIVRPH